MSGLAVYRSLFQNRNLARLLTGEFISTIGDWLYIVAIFVVIYEQSGDAALVGAFGAVRLLPYVLLSVPAGLIADRFDRRMVLLVSDLFRAILMLVLAALTQFDAPTIAIAAVAILAACGSSFFYPAMGAYFPAIVGDERQLGPANSVYSSLGNISYFLGPALGGVLLLVGSVTLAFIVNALTFFVIIAVLWTLPPSRAGEVPAAAEDVTGDETEAAEGGSAVATAQATAAAAGDTAAAAGDADADTSPAEAPRLPRRPLAGLVAIQLVSGLLGGGIQVITVVLAIDVLKAGQEANGYLNAAIGIGGLLGGIVAGGLVLRRDSRLPLLVGVLGSGVGTIALGASDTVPLALLTIGIGAAAGLIVDILGETLFQRFVPNELRGRVTGVIVALGTAAGALGAFALPTLVQAIGPFPALGGFSVVYLVFGVLGILLLGPAAIRQATPYEALIERVAALPLFTGVPRRRLQTATGKLIEVPVAAGQVVITQGEAADRFYVIAEGTFAVTQTAKRKTTQLRTLGPDQVFGELGLLNAAPRSATVTAETDGLLLALEGPDFLELVGTSQALQGRLLTLYPGAGAAS